MSDTIYATFYRKAISLAEIKTTRHGYDGGTCEVKVIETKELTPADYDSFSSNFMMAWPWLEGKGGASMKRSGETVEEIHHCVAVTAPDRETLYVNPQGHSYARYVGIVLSQPDKE